MKNKLALFVSILFLNTICYAQDYIDTILTKNHRTIICHIVLISNENIFYTYNNDQFTSIERKKVKEFISNSKDAEIIGGQSVKDTFPVLKYNDDFHFRKGQDDAKKYYRPDAGTGVLVLSLISPVVGLIPAIACSATPPKEKNLNYRNSVLIKNKDYRNGYSSKAKKIKVNKVWTNFAIAFGVNLIIAAIAL